MGDVLLEEIYGFLSGFECVCMHTPIVAKDYFRAFAACEFWEGELKGH